MKRIVSSFIAASLAFSIIPANAIHYYSPDKHEYIEFKDTEANWYNGFCFMPLNEDEKTGKLIGYDKNIVNSENIIVPGEINGYKITEFASRIFEDACFKECDLSFTMATSLPSRMFLNAKTQKVKLPLGLREIGEACFYGSDLNEITFDEGLEKICERAFAYTGIKELVIPPTVSEIESCAFMFCDELEKIEIKPGQLSEIAAPEGKNAVFMTKSLKTLILPETVTHIGKDEFKEHGSTRGFYWPYKYNEYLIVYAPSNSYALNWSGENALRFEACEAHSILDDYLNPDNYHIEKIIETTYGTVIYSWAIGTPHGINPTIRFVDLNENVHVFSLNVPRESVYNRPKHNNISLSEDGKTLTFTVSFDERKSVFISGNETVLHDAGTYYFSSDLQTGKTIETKFEPKDIIGEDMLSAWAKPEIERAVHLGFVPISIRDNYKRNITRIEFAKLALYFLSAQYGYQSEHIIRSYYNTKNPFPSDDFLAAYATSRQNRWQSAFINKNTAEPWKYEDKNTFNTVDSLNTALFTDLNFVNNHNYKDNYLVGVAYNMGIVNGVGEALFNPDGNITRQEAAAMLMRVYKNYADCEKLNSSFKFNDHEKIADWAMDDVYNINALGVMQGVSNGNFAPLDNYTVEQAIATFLRLYESAPISRKNKNITPLLDYETEKEIYFKRAEGSQFHKEIEEEYDEYSIIYGAWSYSDVSDLDYRLYVFYKNGGVRDLTSFLTGAGNFNKITDIYLNEYENTITFTLTISDTFCLFSELNGTNHVYSMGIYSIKTDIITGNIISIEKLSD